MSVEWYKSSLEISDDEIKQLKNQLESKEVLQFVFEQELMQTVVNHEDHIQSKTNSRT